MSQNYDYIREGTAIYAQSFATIRAETDLGRFSRDEERVVVRVIHASGMTDIADSIRFTPGATEAGRTALSAGRPILCDSEMVARGIIRSRLPAENRIVCTLNEDGVPDLAQRIANTRSAAAVELWGSQLDGALVAIGNAPTALFHLLELIDAGGPRPALILGMAVGFVGAAESKEALAETALESIIVAGRRGGSAMAVAAVNALASERE